MKNLIKLLSLGFLIFWQFILHSCTNKDIPVLSKTRISDITASTASISYDLTSDGGSAVIERGVCWSTNIRPKVSDNKTNDGAFMGSFTCVVRGLDETTKYADGSLIYHGDYSWYNNDIKKKDIFGALYTWTASMYGAESSSSTPSNVQGVCPTGWHLPSDAEWEILTTYLGSKHVAGGKMKETGTTHWATPNEQATN